VASAGSWPRIAAPFALALATFVTYAAALRDGFVWDDHALIVRDPLIRSWRLIWEGFQHFLFTDATASDFYRPLQRLSYTLDYAIFFNSPLGYHLVSILWHAAAAIALYYFAQEFLAQFGCASGRRRGTAFFAALIWALHPVQSAAVVYISGRADPLAATFGFLGLYLGIRSLRAARNARWAFGIGAGVCLLASALSKEIGVIFLLVFLIIAIATGRRSTWLGALGMIAAVLIAYLGLRLPAEHLPPPPQPSMPLLVRPILTARAVAEYAGLIVFPLHLHMDRDVETHPFGFSPASLDAAARRELQTLLGVIVIVAGLYLFYRARGRPAVFVPLLLALVCYLPVSGIIPLNATVAEHWLYLPSAFLFLAAVAAADASRSRILFACLLVWLLFLPVRTYLRTFDWKDQRTFLTRTIAAGGDSARMLINLGGLELSEGHLGAATNALKRALEKEPNNPLGQLNLATVKMKQRDFAGARQLVKAFNGPPELRARAEETLAILEAKESGEINLMRLRLATRIGPPDWQIEQTYIEALANAGLTARAITELKSCLVIAPYRSESWLLISRLLRRIGRPDESAIAFARARATDVHLRDRLAFRASRGEPEIF
jgi:tetratricopeptide (TPR) repeat protein